MDQYQSDWRMLGLGILQCLIPSVVLITTPKRSALRYLPIPCMLWIVYQMIYPVRIYWIGSSCLLGNAVTFVFSALDLLLINPQGGEDFVDSNGNIKSFKSRLVKSIQLMTCTRAINTPRQAKNVPSTPAYYTKRDPKEISRGLFLYRETAIAVWQFLAIDAIFAMASKQVLDAQEEKASDSSGTQWDIPGQKLIATAIPNLIAWFIVTRLMLSFCYRFSSVIFVTLGDSPSNSPPLFGRMADTYTLRNFWGKFWHQMLRVPLTSCSNFLARDLLGLPRLSTVERYINVFIVFFLSGLAHVIIDILRNVTPQESGTLSFFLSFGVGYMIEDGVQALWKRMHYSQSTSGEPLWWQKIVGFVWVAAWLGYTSTWFFGPAVQEPENQMVLVPFSVVGLIGLPALSTIVLAGAVVLKVVFEGEV